MQLVQPTHEHLTGYVDALRRGWSADTQRPAAGLEELAHIERDADDFIALQTDPHAKGATVTLPDGTIVPRLPSYRRWMWDGEFAGSISLRWQVGTTALPPHCLGHIGYTVVPWKQRRGYATQALRAMLPLAREVGLPFVEITTEETNAASQRVILANGGVLIEHFVKPDSHGGAPSLRYVVQLA
jgi:predicted acetyltransferase